MIAPAIAYNGRSNEWVRSVTIPISHITIAPAKLPVPPNNPIAVDTESFETSCVNVKYIAIHIPSPKFDTASNPINSHRSAAQGTAEANATSTVATENTIVRDTRKQANPNAIYPKSSAKKIAVKIHFISSDPAAIPRC